MRKICKDLNEEGFRVVAICKKIITNNKKDFNSTDEKEMTLLGFIGFLDPPKESAKEAIEGLNNAGIRVMVRSEERRVGKECRSRWSPYH